MNRIYTCYNCGFVWKCDEDHIPKVCPTCGLGPEYYLSEPGEDISKRRIHVDPPKPIPDWDRYDTRYHPPRHFPEHSRDGRIRRFVLGYDDDQAEVMRKFYEEIFGWDIYDCQDSDPETPLMFCATGPGHANWEPSVPSFIYGYLRPRKNDPTGKDPLFMIEVDNIDETMKKVIEFGGKQLREKYTEDGQLYAVIEDSEGYAWYLWQTPDTVTWDEPESQTI